MTRRLALATIAAWTACAAAPAAAAPAAPARHLDLTTPGLAAHAAGDTHCERCHTTESWRDVAFAHERTGFPLKAAHAKVSCKACHVASFTAPLGRDCATCHRDVHAGTLGLRCEKCHEEQQGWRTTFDADAHRRGNFPLTGRHAFIPCEECHGDRRDRGFARATKRCVDCHQADFQRTRLASIDHLANGFSTDCQQCHAAWRFAGAAFPQHERCFPLSGGTHSGVKCLACHTSLAGAAISGACSTFTAACLRYHQRTCADHPRVAGFPAPCAGIDRKCFECHPGGRAG